MSDVYSSYQLSWRPTKEEYENRLKNMGYTPDDYIYYEENGSFYIKVKRRVEHIMLQLVIEKRENGQNISTFRNF